MTIHTRADAGMVDEISGEVRAALLNDMRTALQPYMSDAGLQFPMETHLATAKK